MNKMSIPKKLLVQFSILQFLLIITAICMVLPEIIVTATLWYGNQDKLDIIAPQILAETNHWNEDILPYEFEESKIDSRYCIDFPNETSDWFDSTTPDEVKKIPWNNASEFYWAYHEKGWCNCRRFFWMGKDIDLEQRFQRFTYDDQLTNSAEVRDRERAGFAAAVGFLDCHKQIQAGVQKHGEEEFRRQLSKKPLGPRIRMVLFILLVLIFCFLQFKGRKQELRGPT